MTQLKAINWPFHFRGFMKTFGTTKYVYLVALLIAIPRAGESKVVDSRDQEVEQFVVSCEFQTEYILIAICM